MEIPLRELGGEFVSVAGRPRERDCLLFTCPVCRSAGGELTGHGIMVSFLPPPLFPSGAVWAKTGETLDDVTLSPSINCDVPQTYLDQAGVEHTVPSSCKFHGWVRNGKVVV